ncbi:MAG: hypothetical protein R3B06_26220 [Kofleriaceae bacterium]
MRGSTVVLATALAVAPGCNQLFGLDPPRGRDAQGGDVDAPADAPADAPTDGACLGDRDCDGVVDATDNCPDVPNRLQRDFDGDGDGDLCDLCPAVGNDTTVNNSDGDGVGDACDFSPGLECVVWFDTFRDPSGLTSYRTTTAGPWSITGDALVQDSASLADEVLWTQATYVAPTVATGGKILVALPSAVDGGPAADQYSVEVAPVAANAASDLAGSVIGYLHANPAAQTTVLGLASAGQSGATAPVAAPLGVAMQPFSLAASITLAHAQLSTVRATAMGAPSRPGGPLPVALRTRYLSVRFDYLLITDVDPVNCPTAGGCHCPPPPEL